MSDLKKLRELEEKTGGTGLKILSGFAWPCATVPM